MTNQRIENLENRIAALNKKLEIILKHITKKHEREGCSSKGEHIPSNVSLDSSTSNSA